MSVTLNDVELPQDQEPFVLGVTPSPAKSWRRRTVMVAITVGIMAILATLAIVGSGGHDTSVKQKTNVNHDARIQLLKLYAHMRNKKFAPLALRHLTDEIPTLDVTDECKTAFEEHAEETMQKGFELIGKMFEKCFADDESQECKDAQKAIEDFDENVKKACKENGNLCKGTAKDKNGEEEEDVCIPKQCHDETDKIKEYIESMANHEDADIDECKDFNCEITFECDEE